MDASQGVQGIRRHSFNSRVATQVHARVGDQGETLTQLKLREEEDYESKVICNLPECTHFDVVEVGSIPTMIKVCAAREIGWISYQTDKEETLVKWVRKRKISMPKEVGDILGKTVELEVVRSPSKEGALEPEVGDQCETLIQMKMRETEDFKSAVTHTLPETLRFRIIEVGKMKRVRIQTIDGAIGWISVMTDKGEPLVKRVEEKKRFSFQLTRNLTINLSDQKEGEAAPGPQLMKQSSLTSQEGERLARAASEKSTLALTSSRPVQSYPLKAAPTNKDAGSAKETTTKPKTHQKQSPPCWQQCLCC